MKRKNLPRLALAIMLFAGLLLTSSCKSYYLASDFESVSAGHKTLAIVPFEMVFTGKQPKELTDEDLAKISEAESKAFMISYYNEVLRSTKRDRKPFRVDFQHYDKTLNLLKENDIDIPTSWSEDPGKLASILGVDAVVKGRIQKHRLMSDLASYGIDIGTHIISILTNNELWYWVPGGATTSKRINANYSIVDPSGTTLWSIAYDHDADWHSPANELIESINRKSVKYFPYRLK